MMNSKGILNVDLPANPTDVIMDPNSQVLLSSYERSEILSYNVVYYLGTAKSKEARKMTMTS